jgi:hypothetical protein
MRYRPWYSPIDVRQHRKPPLRFPVLMGLGLGSAAVVRVKGASMANYDQLAAFKVRLKELPAPVVLL